MGLSVVIITDREITEIRDTLRSVSFADEIIAVVDKPAKPSSVIKGIRVYFHPLKADFAAQRNFGLSKVKNNWVLFVDDDEIVTKELAQEITSVTQPVSFPQKRKSIQIISRYSGFYLKRLDRYHHQILRNGETGKMKIIRLARKTAGRFVRPVHEYWQIKGPVGELESPLIHERGEMIAPFIQRMIQYGPLDAKVLAKEGKPFSYWRLFLNPLAKFIVNYKVKLGFLDGYAGLFQAYLMSLQSLSVRVFQWQKNT